MALFSMHYLAIKFFHANKIYRFETMSVRRHKIKASMNSRVMKGTKTAFDLELLLSKKNIGM